MNYVLRGFVFKKKIPIRTFGQSMFPLLRDNDLVYFKKKSYRSIKNNDLLVIKKNKIFFTHRVVYKTDKYLITRGNNNLVSDGRISPKHIVGKVYQVKRNGRVFDPETLYLIQSTAYFKEIVKITSFFEKNKISFVLLKGLPLHLYFEKTHPRRIYLDCDVLIDKKHLRRAEKVLLNQGYKKSDTSLSSSQKKLKDKEVETAYYRIINGFPVTFDLHIEPAFMMTQLGKLGPLYQQKNIDQLAKLFFEKKQSVEVNEHYFPILSNDNLILYLALHFFHHNFRGAFRLEFLDRVTRKTKNKNMVFKNISKIIRNYKLRNFVYPSFILLKKYYHTPIPHTFLKDIKPTNSFALGLGSRICHQGSIFDDEPRLQAGITRFKNLFFLSPRPWWIRIWVFFNLQVVYSLFLVFQKRLSKFFSFLAPKKAV